MKWEKNIKKLSLTLCLATILGTSATSAFANAQNEFNMSQGSNSRQVTPAIATNISEESLSGKINLSQGSDSRKITVEPATNIVETDLKYNAFIGAWKETK